MLVQQCHKLLLCFKLPVKPYVLEVWCKGSDKTKLGQLMSILQAWGLELTFSHNSISDYSILGLPMCETMWDQHQPFLIFFLQLVGYVTFLYVFATF